MGAIGGLGFQCLEFTASSGAPTPASSPEPLWGASPGAWRGRLARFRAQTQWVGGWASLTHDQGLGVNMNLPLAGTRPGRVGGEPQELGLSQPAATSPVLMTSRLGSKTSSVTTHIPGASLHLPPTPWTTSPLG